MVWLGEQITQKGIGNGISLLITISIISGLPGAVASAYQMFVAPVGSEGASLGVPEGVMMLGASVCRHRWSCCDHPSTAQDPGSVCEAHGGS